MEQGQALWSTTVDEEPERPIVTTALFTITDKGKDLPDKRFTTQASQAGGAEVAPGPFGRIVSAGGRR